MDESPAKAPGSIDAYPMFLAAMGALLRNLPALLLLVLPVAVIVNVLLFLGAPSIMLFRYSADGGVPQIPANEWLAFAGSFLFFMTFGAWSMAALYRSAEAVRSEGRGLGFVAAYAQGLDRVPAWFGTMLLYFGALVLGALLCVLPLFWVAVAMALGPVRSVVDSEGPMTALAKSRALVRGRFWRVAGYIGLLHLVRYAITVPVATIGFILLQDDSGFPGIYAVGNMISTTLSWVVEAVGLVYLNRRLEQV